MRLKSQIYSIVKKETIEFFRTSLLTTAIFILFSTFLQWFTIRNYVLMAEKLGKLGMGAQESTKAILNIGVSNSLIFVFPMIIPFFANMVLGKSLINEKSSGSLMTILGTGINPGIVWGAKVFVSFIIGYVCGIGCIIADILLIVFYFNLSISWTVTLVFIVFLIAPITALAIIAIFAFLYWTIKSAVFVASIIPTLVAFGLWSYVSGHPMTEMLIQGVIIVLLLSLAILFLFGFIISRLSRQFIVGLD